ncbi:SDR family NAD(P)-dependent oxidoreductase [Kitasatospora mediocidica]|uniref:SDR family NAD(P)-dependent oxidoreductase n=1 Tax=Kitasatospora mediocidica TaxID=58352 RepID=UPI000567B473|nr:SDR family oxidoreductase [Kitasatospora mediocidica]
MPSPAPFHLGSTRALVTGASRGIGRAIALALAEAGADIAVTARSADGLKQTAEAIARTGRRAEVVPGDLLDPREPARIVAEAATQLGGLDLLVHNAGLLPADEHGNTVFAPLQDSTPAQWEPVLTVNLRATVALCRAAHPHLAASPRASILLVSSVAGLMAVPTMEAYGVTKAAELSLTRSLAVGWARQGIRVNALCPGWVRTDMTAAVHTHPPTAAWLLAHVPLGRWAEPTEVAGAAVFLSSPAAAFVTGHALVVDGGLTLPDGGLAGFPKPPPPF